MKKERISCREAIMPMKTLMDAKCIADDNEITLFNSTGGDVVVYSSRDGIWRVEGDIPAMAEYLDEVQQEIDEIGGCHVDDVHHHVFHAGRTVEPKHESHIHPYCEFKGKREAIVKAVKMLKIAEETFVGVFD